VMHSAKDREEEGPRLNWKRLSLHQPKGDEGRKGKDVRGSFLERSRQDGWGKDFTTKEVGEGGNFCSREKTEKKKI